ncbi:hypothetical protein NQ315_012394 [Exocentrus adspersus]|uniref:Nuclease HARBI1 n=1 Tax=Exocentrus adspersus TaxID=1586481 RepID=A0AAV8VMK3_9CUCU|nr:hypothetical protein NQ315_012394 [Exocentrus adspersus]
MGCHTSELTFNMFARGHLSSVTDSVQMDVSTVSRIVVRVSNAIARLSQIYIQMPDHNQVVKEQTKFYRIARFPRIIGVVDGTHVRIQSPGKFTQPLLNPADYAQQLYNRPSLICTRNCIERAIETVLTIIISTAVLQNIAIEMNEPEPPPENRINVNELNYLINMGQI